MKSTFVAILFLAWAVAVFARPKFVNLTVPYHRQDTDYNCGCASAEMVLNFYVGDIVQDEIGDVARTTETGGTLACDMVRVGHFSSLSSARGHRFPDLIPTHGWKEGPPFGLSSFVHRDTQCWAQEALDVVGEGYPLILLMKYRDDDPGGHYRVLVGYNDAASTALFLDPWDRDGQPRVLEVSIDEMCFLWNYTETNFDTVYDPYAAVLYAPLHVAVTAAPAAQGYRVSADVSYPCPVPFCNGRSDRAMRDTPAALRNATGEIQLQGAIKLQNGQRAIVPLGDLQPGSATHLSWDVVKTLPTTAATVSSSSHQSRSAAHRGLHRGTDADITRVDAAVTVALQGLVSGSVPELPSDDPKHNYPAYTYTDALRSAVSVGLGAGN